MTIIRLHTAIDADMQTVFDLARSIDLHLESTAQTRERAVAGVTSGLISIRQSVTWRARHFGVWLLHQSYIPEMSIPFHFTDEMTQGAFKSFRHDHYFKVKGSGTVMEDLIQYEVPFGIAGKVFDTLVLKRYMTRFIMQRNEVFRRAAEVRR